MYRLLLVTDKSDIQKLYSTYAGWTQQGFEKPRIAASAEEGISAFAGLRYDVVSCLLPVEEGKTFYSYIRDYSDTLGMETVRDAARLQRELAGIRRELIARDAGAKEAESLDMLRARQEEFFCGFLRGESYEEAELVRKIAGLQLEDRVDPSQPAVSVSFRVPEGERFLEDVWKYGRDRLEYALKNVFEAEDGKMVYTLLTLNPHHMRLLGLPGGPCSETEAYEMMICHLSEARKTLAQCFDMTMMLRRVNSYRSLFACSRENASRIAH